MTQGRVLGRELTDSLTSIAAAIGRGELRPFVTPRCPRCGTTLADSAGNPRWEIVGRLTFVCLGGCPPKARATLRKAVLS